MNIYKENNVVGHVSMTRDSKYIVLNNKKTNILFETENYLKLLDALTELSNQKECDRILIELMANSAKLTELVVLNKSKKKKEVSTNQLSLF